MKLSRYHLEWARLIEGKDVAFIMEKLILPVLEANQHYYKCKRKMGDNAGICQVVNDFEHFLAQSIDPDSDWTKMAGESGYPLWLLGDRLADDFSEIMHKRINEYFKGTPYYSNGETGFRQMEYELHTIARFAEVDIEVEDFEIKSQPDLLVHDDKADYVVEIKLPTSNPRKSLGKALSQIRDSGYDKGAIVLGLDIVLADLSTPEAKRAQVTAIHSELSDLIAETSFVCFLEFWDRSEVCSQLAWIRDTELYDRDVFASTFHALTGELPESG